MYLKKTMKKWPQESINLVLKKKSMEDKEGNTNNGVVAAFINCPNEGPQRNHELLGLKAERPGDVRGGPKQ